MNAQMMEQTAKTEAIAITTNYFRMNHIKKTIEGSKYHFDMSGKSNTPQYFELMGLMAAKPNYELVPILSEKKAKKQTYKGLTMDLMKKYVEAKADEVVKAQWEKMLDDKNTYPTVKSWFLDEFKVVSVNKLVREIQEVNLSAVKKKYVVVHTKKNDTVPFEPMKKEA